ncbi:MAG: DUF1549 domain-containing protein, partial [Planctomycetota bacterium]
GSSNDPLPFSDATGTSVRGAEIKQDSGYDVNQTAWLSIAQPGGRIEIPDQGSNSRFDFDVGDTITVEALVNPTALRSQAYIVGKGRTHVGGQKRDNQNWAFRLRDVDGQAGINFLFRSRGPAGAGDSKSGKWHRWTSVTGFPLNSGWHHVALRYTFGKPETIRGFIDGAAVDGRWDMAGKTTSAPVVDDAAVWIGSSMNGDRNNSMIGGLDEIAIHRRAIDNDVIKNRFRYQKPAIEFPSADPATTIAGNVSCYLHGPYPQNTTFPRRFESPKASWQQSAMAFTHIPHRYDDWAVRQDWGTAMVVRAVTTVQVPPGEYDLLVRSRSLSRLAVDGQVIATLPRQRNASGAHHEVTPLQSPPRSGMRVLAMDDREKIVRWTSDGQAHDFAVDIMIGGKKLRLEFGETCVAIAKTNQNSMFHLVGGRSRIPLTDEAWNLLTERRETRFRDSAKRDRRLADQQSETWNRRHDLARDHLMRNDVNSASAPQRIDDLILQHARHQRAASQNNAGTPLVAAAASVLRKHCIRCHAAAPKGDLDLRNHQNMLDGGESGEPTIVPGNLQDSELIRRIASDADEPMPPEGQPLAEGEANVLRQWIMAGAPKISWNTAHQDDADQTTNLNNIAERTSTRPKLDNLQLLRKIWLDATGVAPPLEIVRQFQSDDRPHRTRRWVQHALYDDSWNDRWADHWMGYWQDVLAENPNLLKPNLNNTGPFRYWIYESLIDNKPIDRFATELIQMRGSKWGGGAGGFAIASQNDAPMAAKAHIISSAFLGVQMKCARCHDSPYRRSKQQDLFEMSAMLAGHSVQVPDSSRVPDAFFEHIAAGGRRPLIAVTLPADAKVIPRWSLGELISAQEQSDAASLSPDIFRQAIVGDPDNQKNQLATHVTFSRRFAETMANRVWKRLMGAGIIDPVDDWESSAASNPALLSYLADVFIQSGYDLKSLCRTIMHSDAYSRAAWPNAVPADPMQRSFESPYRRRFTAEQIVDNAHHVCGRKMDVGTLTMDIEGRLAPDYFLNFGRPRRAWQMTTLANERDRPSLSMPRCQMVIDVL